jgi:hypothetical protein
MQKLLKNEPAELNQTPETVTNGLMPMLDPERKALSRRQRKRLAKKQRRQKRSALRKLKNDYTEEKDEPKNAIAKLQIKNNDKEQNCLCGLYNGS